MKKLLSAVFVIVFLSCFNGNAFCYDGIHEAAIKGNIQSVKKFINSGVDINEGDERNGETPLFLAAQEGHIEIVKLLLSKGADVNAKDIYGNTPLSCAKSGGHKEIVKLLKKNGAKER